MSADYDVFEEMEAFYDGRLNKEEKQIFESRLAMNSVLFEEYEEYKKIRGGFKKVALSDFRLQLLKTDKELDQPVKSNKTVFAIAASTILLIGLFVMYGHFTSNTIKKYEPEEIGLPTVLADGNSNPLNKAMVLFKQERFAEAENEFTKLTKSDTTAYYQGVIAYKLQNYFIAEGHLKKTISLNSPAFVEKAQVWLALALIKQDKEKEAGFILENIISVSSHPYNGTAKKIKHDVLQTGE